MSIDVTYSYLCQPLDITYISPCPPIDVAYSSPCPPIGVAYSSPFPPIDVTYCMLPMPSNWCNLQLPMSTIWCKLQFAVPTIWCKLQLPVTSNCAHAVARWYFNPLYAVNNTIVSLLYYMQYRMDPSLYAISVLFDFMTVIMYVMYMKCTLTNVQVQYICIVSRQAQL